MEIRKIKIESYIFEKDEGDTEWTCKNHNLMAGDIRTVNQIMPQLKNIEKLLSGKKKTNLT